MAHEMRWWGWGDDARAGGASPAALAWLEGELGALDGARGAVVPFGGGTSVVGGLEPLREGFDALVSLDLGALDGLETLDERSQVALVGAGVRAVELEERLQARGYTLGHYPQSYEYVSI